MADFLDGYGLTPGKIICVGLNYSPANSTWVPPLFPVLFQKPTSGLVGCGESIVLPQISSRVLYEGELAVVIGEKAKNVTTEEALSCTAGFTIANDIGAPDIEARSSQWASGKMFDTFSPVGPVLVPSEEIGTTDVLSIRTKLNGRLVQTGDTSEMVFNVRYLISYISTLTTLYPGDLIFTGSPKRCNQIADPQIPLQAGDQIEVQIEGIGTLLNSVVDEEIK